MHHNNKNISRPGKKRRLCYQHGCHQVAGGKLSAASQQTRKVRRDGRDVAMKGQLMFAGHHEDFCFPRQQQQRFLLKKNEKGEC